jgi:hypothetical protein
VCGVLALEAQGGISSSQIVVELEARMQQSPRARKAAGCSALGVAPCAGVTPCGHHPYSAARRPIGLRRARKVNRPLVSQLARYCSEQYDETRS